MQVQTAHFQDYLSQNRHQNDKGNGCSHIPPGSIYTFGTKNLRKPKRICQDPRSLLPKGSPPFAIGKAISDSVHKIGRQQRETSSLNRY